MLNSIRRMIVDSFRIGYKDTLDFARDRMMLVAFIIMPLFMMVMMGYIFPSQGTLKNTSLAVVNLDAGAMGASVVEPLSVMEFEEGQNLFNVEALSSIEEARDSIRRRTASGAIVIPEDFSSQIASGEQATVTVITDQSNPQVSLQLSGMLEAVMESISAQAGIQNVAALLPGQNVEALVSPFVVQTEGIVSGESNYFQFMAPGVMAMVTVMAVMMGLAGSITREREVGTLDGILVAPINRLSIVLGKTFSQALRGLLQATLVLILAIVLFGVVVHGSIPLMFLMLLLGLFSFIGMGILISTIATAQETAATIMMTIQFPMIFLCGAFFPIEQMPGFMQGIARAIPLTYAVEALRKVIILGAGIPDVLTEIAILAGFGLVMLIVAVPLFNRAITR